jgi:hypothetical protein
MRTGDLVLIGRNDNRLGLCNGTRAVVTAVDVVAGSLTLQTDDERDVTVSAVWAERHDLSHAYAMTLHKAQGLTIDHALLYGSEALNREAGYVGLSRGRRENHIYLSTTSRISGRTGECDSTNPTRSETNSSQSRHSRDGCTPAAAINSRATSSPTPGEVHDHSTSTPAPDRKG